ncbi:MAG: bifunctional nuclease family protein [Spirochaetales bacterium]|nr:bifunctional nuclease family protein [Spirochaetales bacterium]
MLVPAEVWTLAKTDQGNAVLIKPKGADIAVPIFIGQAEAQSILIGLGDVEIQRPLTHDLLISTLKNLNVSIKRVEITDLSEGIFYGRLVVTRSGKEISIDARPSDCIAVAVRVKCNIFIDESVVDEAGISITIVNEHSNQPLEFSPKESEIDNLKKKLDSAVEEENYEEAARIRDKIKELEGKS